MALSLATVGEAPICDFCSSSNVQWVYEAQDIEIPEVRWVSRGAWAACDGCHKLIEDQAWGVLLLKTLETYPQLIQDDEIVVDLVKRLHQLFRQKRLGPAVRQES